MLRKSEKLCPYCSKETPVTETTCSHCGKELPTRKFQIVPEGTRFGINFRGKIRMHDLEWEDAQEILSILEETDN